MCVSFWSVCIFFFSFSTKNPSTNLSGTRRQQCNFFPEGSTRSNGGKLYPTDKSLPRVFVNKNHCVIHWVVIYRADNFIYPLNNQVQKYFRNFIRCYPLRFFVIAQNKNNYPSYSCPNDRSCRVALEFCGYTLTILNFQNKTLQKAITKSLEKEIEESTQGIGEGLWFSMVAVLVLWVKEL